VLSGAAAPSALPRAPEVYCVLGAIREVHKTVRSIRIRYGLITCIHIRTGPWNIAAFLCVYGFTSIGSFTVRF